MRILAIDTSGDACSAALLHSGEIRQVIEHKPRQHGELILGMMEALLHESALRLSELDALAFGRGPGSFTGVRIAASVIQGAAFAAGLPVVPVSTLAAMTQGQFRRGGQRRLLPALDARMDEVYWGCYQVDEEDLARNSGEERVCAPSRVPVPENGGWIGVGPGWSVYAPALRERLGEAVSDTVPDAYCEARDIAFIAAADFAAGRHVSAERAIPVYLRDQVTRTP